MLVSAVSMNGVIPAVKNSPKSNSSYASTTPSHDTFQKSEVSFSSKYVPPSISDVSRTARRVRSMWAPNGSNGPLTLRKVKRGEINDPEILAWAKQVEREEARYAAQDAVEDAAERAEREAGGSSHFGNSSSDKPDKPTVDELLPDWVKYNSGSYP